MYAIIKTSNKKRGLNIMNDNAFKEEFEKLVDWILVEDALPVEIKKRMIKEQAEAYANNQVLHVLNKTNIYVKSLLG